MAIIGGAQPAELGRLRIRYRIAISNASATRANPLIQDAF